MPHRGRGTNEAISRIACRATGIALAAERAFLAALDGSCRTPIAGLGTVEGDEIRLRGLVLSPDGREAADLDARAPVADAAQLGAESGARLRESAPARALGLSQR